MDLHVPNFVSKKLIHRVVYVAIGLSIIGGASYGGASYYLHTQHQQSIQARTDMLKAQAEQNHLTLLSEDEIKDIAAKNTGVAVSDLQFRSIQLQPYSEAYHKKDKHRDKKDRKVHYQNREHDRNQAQPAAPAPNQPGQAADQNTAGDASNQQMTPNAAQNLAETDPAMKAPIYRVKAVGPNGVKYKLKINSVTGELIDSDVDD